MLTHIENKSKTLHCHNCHMQLQKLTPRCPFCNYWFSNYEVLIIQNFKDKNIDENSKT